MVSDLSAECQSNVSALLVRYRGNNPIFAAKTRRQGMRKSVYLIFALLTLGIALTHVRKEDVKQADVLAEAIERDPMPTYVDSLWGYSMRYPSFFERATDSLMEREGGCLLPLLERGVDRAVCLSRPQPSWTLRVARHGQPGKPPSCNGQASGKGLLHPFWSTLQGWWSHGGLSLSRQVRAS